MRGSVLSALLGAALLYGAPVAAACGARSGSDALGCRALDVEIVQVYTIAFTRNAGEPDCEDRAFTALYYGRKIACNVTARQLESLNCAPPHGLIAYLPSGEVQAAFCRAHKDMIARLAGEPAPPPPTQAAEGARAPDAPAR